NRDARRLWPQARAFLAFARTVRPIATHRGGRSLPQFAAPRSTRSRGPTCRELRYLESGGGGEVGALPPEGAPSARFSATTMIWRDSLPKKRPRVASPPDTSVTRKPAVCSSL